MKKIEIYLCELCGKRHPKESDALNCEDSHLTDKDIEVVDMEHHQAYSFPAKLLVKGSEPNSFGVFIFDGIQQKGKLQKTAEN